MALDCRLIEPVGWQLRLTGLWDGDCSDGWGLHSSRKLIGENRVPDVQPPLEGVLTEHWDDAWWATMTCERCGSAVPSLEVVKRSSGWKQFYDTKTGQPEPGDMYWVKCWSAAYTGSCFEWDNCEGRHLYVILPNGHVWDIDSRASNCTLKADRTHRCWIRTGEPPNVTAGKTGHTCSAGGGSIKAGSYHGFLRGGKLT